MFGPSGWCGSCGMPLVEQCGPLTLQRRGMSKLPAAWVPNWRFDAYCLDESLAREVSDRFHVEFWPISWRGTSPSAAEQMVVPSTAEAWFDKCELSEALVAAHGISGATCDGCGIWRWMPLASESLPKPRQHPSWDGLDVVASPEWFGDGCKSFRQIMIRRGLAELIAAASPDDFEIHD